MNEQYYTGFVDKDGNVQPIKVWIVCGSPGSGKSTYVKNHMKSGDLIVDLDLIKQSISGQSKLETPDELLNVAISIRDTIYEMIERKKVNAQNIWIIADLPNRIERKEMKRRFNATLVEMNDDYETCRKRILSDDERIDKEKALYILDKYQQRKDPPLNQCDK